ncbi:hypothetical protein DYI41_20580 [Marinobacter salarius]|jgi:uncharacterized membrane protein|uniref:hypothetical protein n=1 Tax=Marinobacter salarius TaxID=1420917 RepID=UPI001BCBC040|nr:hypothetical protein [Marinobacter salarius]MBS8233308.1 hypothetical protein [Marinobacter salarius]
MDDMNDKWGIAGLASSSIGLSLAYVVDFAWRVNDGITGVISPYLAKILSYLPIAEAPKGFSSATGFQLTEVAAIWLVGSTAVIFGLVGIFLSFMSIKKREDVRASFGALAVGCSPIIVLSLVAGLFVFLVAGLTAVFYRKHLTSSSSSLRP